MKSKDPYWFRVTVAVNLLVAALFGAEMYETVCAAAWRNRGYGWAMVVIWITNLIQPNHCKVSERLYHKLMQKSSIWKDKYTLHFLWRWVERGRDSRHTPKECLEVMWYHPEAPWNYGEWPEQRPSSPVGLSAADEDTE